VFKIVFLIKRKEGTTKEHFREYYERQHAELAKKYISHLLVKYTRSYITWASYNPTANPLGTAVAFDYDVITEMWMKDRAAFEELQRIMSDPKINKLLADDEENYSDRRSILMITTDECDTGVTPLAKSA